MVAVAVVVVVVVVVVVRVVYLNYGKCKQNTVPQHLFRKLLSIYQVPEQISEPDY